MNMPPPPPPSHSKSTTQSAPRFTTKVLAGYPLPMASQYVPAWVEVLRTCGYPDTVLVLDFESYFDEDFDLRKLSTPEYVMDKRWEVLGLASLSMGGQLPFSDYEKRTQWHAGEEAVERYLRYAQANYGPDLAGVTVTMQNASFDATVLAMRYGIFPKYLIDTKSLALAWNTRAKNDLGTQAKRWGLPDKGETKDFKGATNRRGRYLPLSGRGKKRKPPQPRPLMDENQAEALGVYACNDAARQWEIFTILLPRLSNPKTELRIQQHSLELVTKPVLQADRALGLDLIQKMAVEPKTLADDLKLTEADLSGNISFDKLLTEALPDDPQRYKKHMPATEHKAAYWAYGLAKDDSQLALLKAHPSERVRKLVEARSAVKSWPLHAARVEKILAMSAAWGGLMPVPLQYWGAHTGRWTGGWGINLQNLPKKGHKLVQALRHLLTAPDGQTLVLVDLAGIEARVLAWIAGQWDLVSRFANKEEIYCGFAAKVLGKPVRKARKDDPPAIAKLYTQRRDLGKVGVLGCGYGMGKDRVVDYAATDPYNLKLTIEEAEKIVNVYRESNTAITGFWRAIEKAFVYTAKYKTPCVMERGLAFSSTDEIDVIITLPNGRELHYHKVRLEPGKYNDSISVYNEMEHSWEYLWGGTITENVVQAISRDVLIEAAMRLEDRQYHTAFHIHDEIVMAVPEAQAEECLHAAEEEMSKTPVWAPRLPLAAEGGVSKFYRKL